MALEAGRARVENGNSPQSPALPRSDRDAMEEFLEPLRVLLGALGFPLLQPIAPGKRPKLEESDSTTNPLLNRTLRFQVAKSGINATGAVTDEGFVVYQGSLGSPIVKPYLRARRKVTRAFGRRCIAASGVARRSNTPVCSTPRALLASRIGALGAPVYFAAGP